MGIRFSAISFATVALVHSTSLSGVQAQTDPCSAIANQTWVSPSAVRTCFTSFPMNATIQANIIDVLNKTFTFHTSTDYQIQAPAPFMDTANDIVANLARIAATTYDSDFDLHVDISHSVRRLNDGHSVYLNMCYDQTYTTYLPIPLVLLVDAAGNQGFYIAPEAYVFASLNFPEELATWQTALGSSLELQSLSGAKVVTINGDDPWAPVEANAAIAGSFESLATRENGYFASFSLLAGTWNYFPGQFAQMALPLNDTVTLEVQLVNSTTTTTFTLPYRSKFGSSSGSVAFTDSTSFWNNNCLATSSTNGVDVTDSSISKRSPKESALYKRFGISQWPSSDSPGPISKIVDINSAPGLAVPTNLLPPVSYYNGFNEVWMYLLPDGKTAVISMGDMETGYVGSQAANLEGFLSNIYYDNPKVDQLIIDVTNNPGGVVCVAEVFHRILSGKKNTTFPNSGLPGVIRSNTLAQNIVSKIIAGADPNEELIYNPTSLPATYLNGTAYPKSANYLANATTITVNGKQDQFSPELGPLCESWYTGDASAADIITPYFNASSIVIISNGRCASACGLFVTTMAKEDGVRVISLGGKLNETQQYAGTIGGISSSFYDLDTAIKTTGLKSDPNAPPDFITNSYQGFNFRLAYGVEDPTTPEEWQSRPANSNFQLTAATINQPWALWNAIAAEYF